MHPYRLDRLDELTDWSADELSGALHRRQVSCREVMAAYLARIDRINPHCKALVNLAPADDLLRQADARDAELARGRSRGGSRGGSRGWMHGMPQAIKDTAHALGFPSTQGSPLLQRALPQQDSVYVARMKAAGAIVIAKTNMPEFGLGSHTYNRLFGRTPNAWDAQVSAGGSSGGAAVALAQRLLPVADGSDFMGSLRNPAGWNHVFGLRPSQGRVPAWPKPELWLGQLAVDGPMARSVVDLARLLSILAGRDPRAPLSMAQGPQDFCPPPDASVSGLRIGWLADLEGYLPMEGGILPLCEQALARLADGGAHVEPLRLGFSPQALWDAWLVWRAALVAPAIAAHLGTPGAREQIKPEALWEHDQGLRVSAMDLMAASATRSAFYGHLLALFERFDLLALPVAQVWPFDVAADWPRQIGAHTMDSYHRWMEVTIYATLAGLPAISVPAGFHTNGRWPMGLQLIGRPQGDADLLSVAAAYEARSAELLRLRSPEPSRRAGIGQTSAADLTRRGLNPTATEARPAGGASGPRQS